MEGATAFADFAAGDGEEVESLDDIVAEVFPWGRDMAGRVVVVALAFHEFIAFGEVRKGVLGGVPFALLATGDELALAFGEEGADEGVDGVVFVAEALAVTVFFEVFEPPGFADEGGELARLDEDAAGGAFLGEGLFSSEGVDFLEVVGDEF